MDVLDSALTLEAPSALFWRALGAAALALILYMLLAWRIAVWRERADLADVAWGGGFVVVAWTALAAGVASPLGWIVNGLVTVWGLRLMWHVYRQHASRGEDFRYVAMRQRWGSWTPLVLATQVFGLQTLILLVVALPVIWVHTHPIPLPQLAVEWILPIWAVGFLFEAVGDAQMARFRKTPHPKGAICQSGLWSISRHPNYFGELTQWWAIWALAAAVPGGWILLASPLLLTFLILQVSGIRPVEESMKERSGWAEYAAKTPRLVPHAVGIAALSGLGWVGTLVLAAHHQGTLAAACVLLTLLSFVVYVRHWSITARAELPTFLAAALILGLVQESLWTRAAWVIYPDAGAWPPIWILGLYLPFAVGYFASLQSYRLPLIWALLVGGIGGCLAYASGSKLGAAQVSWEGYGAIFLLWGATFALLGGFKSALNRITAPWQDPDWMARPLTACFDQHCPLCMREMDQLQKRRQLGRVVYLAVASQSDLDRVGIRIGYKQSMEALHAFLPDGQKLVGIEALAELYARTDHQAMAICLLAPGFRSLWALLYAGWARLRPRTR
jgi:steroid 5-alpha reductase family enzyme/predicted DCC family thiol-disulfide oxidoreductase YuxK